MKTSERVLSYFDRQEKIIPTIGESKQYLNPVIPAAIFVIGLMTTVFGIYYLAMTIPGVWLVIPMLMSVVSLSLFTDWLCGKCK